jgi:hypothetical protein
MKSTRSITILKPANSPRLRNEKRSEDEVNRLMSLHRQYATKRYGAWEKIVAQMPGRTMLQCQQKVRYHLHGRKYRERYRLPPTPHRVTAPIVTPESVWAEAAHRRRLSRPTLTAEFFGDPLPGYSALDRRG